MKIIVKVTPLGTMSFLILGSGSHIHVFSLVKRDLNPTRNIWLPPHPITFMPL